LACDDVGYPTVCFFRLGKARSGRESVSGRRASQVSDGNYGFLIFWFDNRILLRKKHLQRALAFVNGDFALVYSSPASRIFR
jgi:hypothetical protein